MNKTLLLLFVLVICGCGSSDEKTSKVYFAGEIVNPTSDYVVLYKGDTVVDSVTLDSENRFRIELDSVDEGLHHFYHKPELQYVFLENGDSLMARLNTYYFDESLVFSGRGEEINNFLIEMFLTNEKEEDMIYDYYKLEPRDFCNRIDSLNASKVTQLEELHEETPLTDQAYDLAKSGIIYSSYMYKEPYPYYHKKKMGDQSLHEMPEDFYTYHQQVDFNNKELTYLRPYYNFMKYHIGNLSYMSCKEKCKIEDWQIAKNQLHFSRHQLHMIDSLVAQKELRDNLFRNVAFYYLLKNDSESNIEVFINEFHELSGNNKHMDEIDRLYRDIKNIQPNKEIPDIGVYDADGNMKSLRDLTGQGKVVLYFWSATEKGHFKNISRQITKLKKEHPEYSFIGINLRTDLARWKSMLAEYNLDKGEQFWAENFEEMAHSLVIYDPFKSIIANNGVIVDGFANVYSSFK